MYHDGMSGIEERYGDILRRVESAAGGRSILLIAVTKTVAPAAIREAFRAGVRTFGENRVQEALPKIQELQDLNAEWHFIGHLQTNKTRDAVRNFAMIHSVDSGRLLLQIEKEAVKADRIMPVLLELNLGGEESKSGMTAAELPRILEASASLGKTVVRGLMTVPPYLENPEHVRPYFRQLRELRDRFQPGFPALAELSMGMSHDFAVAIQEGATMVRVGTALFGER